MTTSDSDVIGACLRAAADGPFFEDWEFGTLFGLKRSVVRRIAVSWPDVDRGDATVDLAVNNAMVNLLGYPHGLSDDLAVYVAGGEAAIREAFARWKSAG